MKTSNDEEEVKVFRDPSDYIEEMFPCFFCHS